MLGSHSSIAALTLAALTTCLTATPAQASPKQGTKSPRIARVVPQRPCSKRAVEVIAGKESATFALAKCDGSASPEGVDQISLLARPSGVSRPKEPLSVLGKVRGSELAAGIRRVDPRLVERLELVVDHFRKGGQPEHIVLAPGAASSSASAGHRGLARSLDFRVDGVTGEALASFCKTLPETACTSSPRGPMVRMEVRSVASRVADVDPPAQPSQPGSVTTEPVYGGSGGKLAPLPASDHPAAVGAVKPGDDSRFL
jgi:hypothetical protein